jgi:hypothetical protein
MAIMNVITIAMQIITRTIIIIKIMVIVIIIIMVIAIIIVMVTVIIVMIIIIIIRIVIVIIINNDNNEDEWLASRLFMDPKKDFCRLFCSVSLHTNVGMHACIGVWVIEKAEA